MKWLAMWVVVLGCGLANLVHAESIPRTVIFHCDMRDGTKLHVTRNPMTDQFVLEFGHDISNPSLRVVRQGNNLGTSMHLSSAEAAEGREIYFTNGKSFYTIGAVDKAGQKEGYFQVTEDTKEVDYQTCVNGTVQSLFDNAELFKSLTPVD